MACLEACCMPPRAGILVAYTLAVHLYPKENTMAMDLLQKFLGSNPQKQQDYADFVQRYQNDPNSISDEEAARRYRELMRNSPQDLADQANQHGFGQLPEQDRRQLAQQYEQAHGNPGRPFDGYSYNDPNQAADPRQLGRMTQQAE